MYFEGFGPFGNHKVNASWAAVQELQQLVANDDFILVTHEIPVVYAAVDDIVPALWKEHRPKVAIFYSLGPHSVFCWLLKVGHPKCHFSTYNYCDHG